MRLIKIISAMRPYQWSKNFFLFAALIFARKLFDLASLVKVAESFLLYCLLSGSLYIFNDLMDLKEDRNHPLKSRRPLASGALSPNLALTIFLLGSSLALFWAWSLSFPFFMITAAYFLFQIAYSLKLKHIVILDIFILASGFVIRVIAGGVVIKVPISSWLLICTSLLALFIGMSKRRHELVLLEDKAPGHRPVLKEYSAYLLDQMISVVTASTVIAYCLYTISPETVEKFGTRSLIYSSIFVLYGIFRYLYLVHQKGYGGSPEELVLKDKPMLINITLWIVSVFLIIYIF
ncbi:MAG: decaprenyl-phosphate phosphoribosyltransferase [Candidatus Aminicenantes bacterium]|nr:decaprenyl-phosphate phosphoribosyltransferase [Candidatus Aminicenantes bacterium]